MPCASFNINIVQRSEDESAVAASAYQSGETLFCQYDQTTKDYGRKERVVYKEIMLPPNAPPEYADRQTLWNAAEAVERCWNSQLARRFKIALPRELSPEENRKLARQFCEEQFLSRGMTVDLAIHDSGDDNPHFHVLTTMRALDKNGRWLPKCHKEYDLDEQGQRIRLPSGSWKSHKVDVVDWNDQRYGEIWRHEWEVLQNHYLEQANRPERIDMRSYERQGIDQIPQVHLGAAATALERKGIQTELGNMNRQIAEVNEKRRSLKAVMQTLKDWLKEITKKIIAHEIIAEPDDHDLASVLMAYLEIRKGERSDWSVYGKQKGGATDLKKIAEAQIYLQEKNLCTVSALGKHINATSQKKTQLEKTVRKNKSRIRDIADVMKTAATMQTYQSVWEEYSAISWKGKKQKFYDAHSQELEAYKKADRLLRKLKITLPPDEAALNNESEELTRQNAVLSAELDAAKAELAKLKEIRYCVRKVIPEALPTKTSDGSIKIEEQFESLANAMELKELTEDPPERQEQQKEKSNQEH